MGKTVIVLIMEDCMKRQKMVAKIDWGISFGGDHY